MLEITVSDDGIGLSPRPDSPGAGLGIPLMTRPADHIEIDRAAGTTVRLRFALTGSAAPDAVAARRFGRDNAARSRRRVSPERGGASGATSAITPPRGRAIAALRFAATSTGATTTVPRRG